jgi:TonB family protein
MWMRLIVCLSASMLLHLFFFSQSLTIMAPPRNFLYHPVAVDLVEGMQQGGALQEIANPAQAQVVKTDTEEGMSFDTEGTVSSGYMDILKARIFKVWQYPEDAINKGQEGKVTISFVLNGKGEVVDIGILKTSGSYSLDSAAMAAVEQAAPFGSFGGDVKNETLKVTGHFCYVLD